jgi:hypothetical protein
MVKAQSALEYMMTYGWAILIIVIVAIILYSMGIFSPSSSLTTTITGFSGLGVTQAACINTVNNQILAIYVSNTVGYPVNVTNINVSGNNGVNTVQNVNSLLRAGQSGVFYVNGACNKSTSSYSGSVAIEYTEPSQILPGPYFSNGKISRVASNQNNNLVGNFSGNSNYISLKENSVVNTSSSFSVAIWFKTTSYGAMIWVGNGPMPNNVGAWWNPLYVANNGSLFGGDDNGTIFQTNHVVSNNAWNFAVLTQSVQSKTETLYLNGVEIGVISPHIQGRFTPYYWAIGGGSGDGANWPDLPPISYFNGTLSDVQMYSNALSAQQVNALYLKGKGGSPIAGSNLMGWWPLDGNANDYSGNNNNGVAIGVTWTKS